MDKAKLLNALGNETRLQTAIFLRGNEWAPVGHILEKLKFGFTDPAMSRHLRVMREAGAVECKIDQQMRRYRLTDEASKVIEAIQ